MTDDAHLLRQYCEVRSEAAFAELVERHLGLVYNSALRQLGGDVYLAQDVTQVVFVLLAEKSRVLLGHPSLAGWLYATTHFKVSEALRAERRRKLREGAAAAMRDDPIESAATTDEEQILAMLDQVMLDLNSRDREAILLRFFEGQPYAKIAERIALTEKAAHKRVERALERLRGDFVRRGITSTTEAFGLILTRQSGLGTPLGLAAKVTGAAMASPASTASLGVLHLMTTTKMTTSIAAIAAVLAAGLAWYERADLQRTTAALAISQQESAVLTGQLLQLGLKAKALERDQIVSQPAPASAGSALPAAGGNALAKGTGGTAPQIAAPPPVSADVLNRDPKVHETLGKIVDWNNAQFFGPLLQAAGLSPDQVQRAEYLIGQKETFEGYGPEIAFGATPGSQAYSDIEAELKQTLGTAGVAAMDNYEITRSIGGLAGTLYDTDTPLSADQASQLTQVLVSTNRGIAAGDSWYHLQNTDWDAALAQASQFLSPPQLNQLKNTAIRLGYNAP